MDAATQFLAVFASVVITVVGTAAWTIRLLIKSLLGSYEARIATLEEQVKRQDERHIQDLGMNHSFIGGVVQLAEMNERVLQKLLEKP